MDRIIIGTERTYLKHLTPDDALNFYDLNTDKGILKHTGDVPFENIDAAHDFLQAYDQYQKYGVGRMAVISKTENKFIGWCGLKYSPEPDEYDLGFRFFRKYWNNGYATETAKACINFGFEKLKLVKIVGRAIRENVASIRVLEKIGMVYQMEFYLRGQIWVIFEIVK